MLIPSGPRSELARSRYIVFGSTGTSVDARPPLTSTSRTWTHEPPLRRSRSTVPDSPAVPDSQRMAGDGSSPTPTIVGPVRLSDGGANPRTPIGSLVTEVAFVEMSGEEIDTPCTR